MKKGSSGNRKKRRPPRLEAPVNRYPTRDNVYNLQRERQRRQAQAERQAREWQQAHMRRHRILQRGRSTGREEGAAT